MSWSVNLKHKMFSVASIVRLASPGLLGFLHHTI